VYLLLTVGLKYVVHNKFRDSIITDNLQITELNTTPTILNAVLWSAIAYNDSMIYVAEYSFLKKDDTIRWKGYSRNLDLVNKYDCADMRTLVWFSDGNYFLKPSGEDTIAFFNIKWGRGRFDTTNAEEAFFFYFTFVRDREMIIFTRQQFADWDFGEALGQLTDRIGI
jgi:inner membrane protein